MSAPSQWTVDTLKEHLEALRADDHLAWQRAREALDREGVQVSELRAEVGVVRADYLRKDSYELAHHTLESRLERIEKTMAEAAGIQRQAYASRTQFIATAGLVVAAVAVIVTVLVRFVA